MMIKILTVLCAFILLANSAKHPTFKYVEAKPTSDALHYDPLTDVDLDESESSQFGYGFSGRNGFGNLGSLGSLGRGFGSSFGRGGFGNLGRGLGRGLGNFGSLGGLGLGGLGSFGGLGSLGGLGGLGGHGGLGGRNFGLGRF